MYVCMYRKKRERERERERKKGYDIYEGKRTRWTMPHAAIYSMPSAMSAANWSMRCAGTKIFLSTEVRALCSGKCDMRWVEML